MITQDDFTKMGYPPDPPGDIGDDAGLDEPVASTIDDEISAAMKEPAYMDGTGREHTAAVARVQKLFQQRAAEGDPRSETERICDSAIQEQVEQQAVQRDAALADFDWLAKNGFDEPPDWDGPPADIPEYLAQGWKQQRLLAESDYANLGLAIEKSLSVCERGGLLPPVQASGIRQLLQVKNLDPALKGRVDQIAAGIIALLHDSQC